jgi:hypothetical protein
VAFEVGIEVDDLAAVVAPEGAAGCRVRVARTTGEMYDLRGSWEQLQGDVPATDPDLFAELLEVETGVVRPHVVLLERDGVPEAACIGKLRSLRLPTEHGPASLFAPRVRALVVVDRGVLGQVSTDSATALLRELLAPLATGEADICVFRHLAVSSPVRQMLESAVSRRRRGAATWPVQRWTRDIPADYETFLGTVSKNMRRTLRQPGTRLEQAFGGRVRYRLHRSPGELDDFLADAESVASVTYQRRRGVGFENDERTRILAMHSAERGWFRGWLLYVDERPIAFEQGFVYRDTFHWVTGGFDPAFAEHRPGLCLIARVLEDICADPGVGALDFGLGDATYKERLGCSSSFESDLVVFAPRLRPLAINLVSSALVLVARPLHRFHER